MKVVKQGSNVLVDYVGRFDDGKLFDTSKENLAKEEGTHIEDREYQPLEITLGQGMLIKGFEDALIGMKEGEEKTAKIKAKEAYGETRPELIKKFPKDPERDKELKVGMVVLVNVEGRQIPARVTEAGEEIALDFNHPLAGKDLTFEIKVVKIKD